MNLEDQGLFAIGYYHQRQRLFQRAEATQPSPAGPGAAAGDAPEPRQQPEVGPRRRRKETPPQKVPAKARPGKAPAQQRRTPKRRATPKEK
jgi:hypothetical protein